MRWDLTLANGTCVMTPQETKHLRTNFLAGLYSSALGKTLSRLCHQIRRRQPPKTSCAGRLNSPETLLVGGCPHRRSAPDDRTCAFVPWCLRPQNGRSTCVVPRYRRRRLWLPLGERLEKWIWKTNGGGGGSTARWLNLIRYCQHVAEQSQCFLTWPTTTHYLFSFFIFIFISYKYKHVCIHIDVFFFEEWKTFYYFFHFHSFYLFTFLFIY